MNHTVNQQYEDGSRTLRFIRIFFYLCMILIPSTIFTYFVRGGALSGIEPAAPPTPLMGLEQLRANLFRDGFLLPDGYADPLIGPMISQMLSVGEALQQFVPEGIVIPGDIHRHFLLIFTMIGLIWGGSLLYKNIRLNLFGALLAALFVSAISYHSHDSLWFLTIYTWVCVGLTASWKAPQSGKRAFLCGITLSHFSKRFPT